MKPTDRMAICMVIATAFLFLLLNTQAEEELRTWTDNTGKFTFQGTYVQSRGSQVMLKREDGQLQRVPLSRLSAKDREYIASLSSGLKEASDPLTGIAWYGSVEPAFEEAKRSRRPIMFMAAATQCRGVPGVF